MRAWHCHGRNQRELVDRLAQAGIVSSPPVREAMRLVDRQFYLPPDQKQQAYLDAPQSIGLGQTISAPHMHAHVLEEIVPYLQKQPSDRPLKVLDVGCGSGYLTACMGRLFQARPEDREASAGAPPERNNILGKPGRVFGIDIYPHLVNLSKENIMRNDSDLIATKMVTLQVANGWNGLTDEAPFDAIVRAGNDFGKALAAEVLTNCVLLSRISQHVGAAASDFPTQLALQLRVGGVLIVPVGPNGGVQNLYKIERISGDADSREFVEKDFHVTELLGVRYVPLIRGP